MEVFVDEDEGMDELIGQYQKNLEKTKKELGYTEKTKIHNKIIEDKANLYSKFEYSLKKYTENEKEQKMKRLLDVQKSLNTVKQLNWNQAEISELNNVTVKLNDTKVDTKVETSIDQEKIKS